MILNRTKGADNCISSFKSQYTQQENMTTSGIFFTGYTFLSDVLHFRHNNFDFLSACVTRTVAPWSPEMHLQFGL